ncbi:MAG: NfeD family protein [Clostridia bacterium]|nr:NfeD family protein [Clostridia bacterium]
MTYVWAALLVIFIIGEAVTTALVAIWFIPGAILAMVFSMLGFPLWLQLLGFLLPSLGILLRIVFREKFFKNKVVATNSDALIGKTALVTEAIDNLNERGGVKVDGARWSARSSDGSEIPAGTVVVIEEIRGVKLICKKAETDS